MKGPSSLSSFYFEPVNEKENFIDAVIDHIDGFDGATLEKYDSFIRKEASEAYHSHAYAHETAEYISLAIKDMIADDEYELAQ